MSVEVSSGWIEGGRDQRQDGQAGGSTGILATEMEQKMKVRKIVGKQRLRMRERVPD